MIIYKVYEKKKRCVIETKKAIEKSIAFLSGSKGIRTPDPLLVRQML